jgi:hypothetical protein
MRNLDRDCNAFDPDFLRRFGEEDQPPNNEGETAGPWEVAAAAGGWTVTAAGAGAPEAVARERAVALLAAAALPATGRPPRFTLEAVVARPFPLLDGCRPAGSLAHHSLHLVEVMNALDAVAASPPALAALLAAAGAEALARAGRLLAEGLASVQPAGGGR